MTEQPTCAVCAKLPACIGAYEGHSPIAFACDECCGHGNEDGWCVPLAKAAEAWERDQQILVLRLNETGEEADRLRLALSALLARIDERQPSGPRWGEEAHEDIAKARALLTRKAAT